MNQISKPHLVDLLRIFDRRKYFVPRIRYASVRSKPELLADLANYFDARIRDDFVVFTARKTTPHGVPAIQYCIPDRRFHFDGEEIDAPTQSRAHPRFCVIAGPVTLTFDEFCRHPPAPEGSPSTCTAAASLSAFRELGLRDPSDSEA